MTTEPTQRTEADALNELRVKAERDLKEAAITISNLGTNLNAANKERVSFQRDLATATQRIAELESRVKQLEAIEKEATIRIVELQAEIAGMSPHYFPPPKWNGLQVNMSTGEPLSPSPPAVEVERWAKEKAAYKAGKRIQQRIRIALQDWTPWTYCPYPTWGPDLGDVEYRIHPDDDAPPVQTEEKPATVPHLRWHRLSELTRDDVGTIELLAASCCDGIGVIARWTRNEDGTWEVWAWDTEQQGAMQPVTNFIDNDGECVPPEPPTMFDDLG